MPENRKAVTRDETTAIDALRPTRADDDDITHYNFLLSREAEHGHALEYIEETQFSCSLNLPRENVRATMYFAVATCGMTNTMSAIIPEVFYSSLQR